MISNRYHKRISLVALAAVVVMSWGVTEASACSTKKGSDQACALVRGCCLPQANVSHSVRVQPGVGESRILPWTPIACNMANSSGQECSCRSQAPAAPAPKPARTSTTEDRQELSETLEPLFQGENQILTHLKSHLAFAANHISVEAPLYLRNERLLF